MFVPTAFVFVFSAFLLGSAGAREEDLRAPAGFPLASNSFGFDLYRLISEENGRKSSSEGGNIFFSPYSVATTLAMLHQGSGGESANQLEEGLGLKLAKLADNKPGLAGKVAESDASIFNLNASNVLKSANALLTSPQFQILDSFKQTLKESFHSEVFQLNFDKPEETKHAINQWVSNKTAGKIAELLTEPPSTDTKLALLNAVYFKGIWANHFNKNQTKPAVFTGKSGVEYKDVPFLQIKENFKVAQLQELDAALIELPYEGGDLALFGLLPKRPSDDLSHLRAALNPWYLEAAISRAYETKITLKFPKLDLKTEYDLVGTLKTLGIQDVFSGKADLSGISAEGNIAVGGVLHKATVEINEKGSEAAASTYVPIVLLSAIEPREEIYDFNHPFLFFIRHAQTGLILFLGEINRF